MLLTACYEDLLSWMPLPRQRTKRTRSIELPLAQPCPGENLNAQPTATASAAQVRRPIYRDSVALWRRYETQLAPLAEALRAEGVL